MNQLTFSLGEPHANHSQSLDSEKDWTTLVATWPSSILYISYHVNTTRIVVTKI